MSLAEFTHVVTTLGHSDLQFNGKRLREQPELFKAGPERPTEQQLYEAAAALADEHFSGFSTPIIEALLAYAGKRAHKIQLHLIVTDQKNSYAATDTIHALPLVSRVLGLRHPDVEVTPHICGHPLDQQGLWLQWLRERLLDLTQGHDPILVALTAGPSQLGALSFAARSFVPERIIELIETPLGPDKETLVAPAKSVPLDAAVTVLRLLQDAAARYDYGQIEAALNTLDSPLIRPLAQFARKFGQLQRFDLDALVADNLPSVKVLPKQMRPDCTNLGAIRLSFMQLATICTDALLDELGLQHALRGGHALGVALREGMSSAQARRDAAMFASLCCAAEEKALALAGTSHFRWMLLGKNPSGQMSASLKTCFRDGLLKRSALAQELKQASFPPAAEIRDLAEGCRLLRLRLKRNHSLLEHGTAPLSMLDIESATGAKPEALIKCVREMFSATTKTVKVELPEVDSAGCVARLVAAYRDTIPYLLRGAAVTA